MLTCKEQVARSSDYLDGQLTFRERLLVRHLELAVVAVAVVAGLVLTLGDQHQRS